MLIISRGVDLPIKTIYGWLFKIIILAYVIVYAASDLVEIFRDSSDLRSRFQVYFFSFFKKNYYF